MRRAPRSVRYLLTAAVLLLAAAAAAGCYTARTSLPSHIKSIAVPVFANKSIQPAMEDDLTQRVIARFQSRNILQIGEPNEADAEIDGTIVNYENKVYRFDSQERAEEYIVIVTIDASVVDRAKNHELWSEQGMRASSTYLISGAQARTEADARKDALDQLAEILYSRTVEGW